MIHGRYAALLLILLSSFAVTAAGAPIEVVSANDKLDDGVLKEAYSAGGFKAEEITLRNTASGSVLVDVRFGGELEGLGRTLQNQPIAFSAGQQKTVDLEFELGERRLYNGSILFQASGSDVEGGTTVLPAELYVTQLCDIEVEQICISGLDSDKFITEQGTYEFVFTASAIDDVVTELSVDPRGNISEGVPERTFTVTGIPRRFTIPFNVSGAGRWYYSGDLMFSTLYDDGRIPVSIRLDITRGSVELNLEQEAFGDQVAGDTILLQGHIKNTGAVSTPWNRLLIDDMRVNKTLGYNIAPGEKAGFSLNLTVPNTTGEQRYEALLVSDRRAQDRANITMNVFQPIDADVRSVRDELNNYQTRLENISDHENATRVDERLVSLQQQVATAEDLWEEGDYEEAQAMLESVRSDQETIAADIAAIEAAVNKPEGLLSDLPIRTIAIILAVIAAIGVILYFSIVPE